MIHLYKTMPSRTAVDLIKTGVVRRIRKNSKLSCVLNYGSTKRIPNYKGKYINHPDAVEISSDKIKTFNRLTKSNLPCVPWTTDVNFAKENWSKTIIVARTLTRASEGRGAIFVQPGDELPHAPLYTQYIKKESEYRVNVLFEKVLNVRKKKRRVGYEGELNQYCRSYKNGWVFCQEGVQQDNAILNSLATLAIISCGLDFGAVDIIYNKHYDQYFVLEVNSAPGMEGTTFNNFVKELANHDL